MEMQKIYFFALSVWTSYIDALTVKKNVTNPKNIISKLPSIICYFGNTTIIQNLLANPDNST